MVKLFPIRAIKSTFEDDMVPQSPVNKTPNRFRSKIYDRSVCSGDECVKAYAPCKCYSCCPYPVVVVSAGESICDQYNITSRNIKEFLDGGLLEPVEEEGFIIYGQETPSGQLQIGILGAIEVEDCLNNVVKKHELCIPESETPVSSKLKLFQSLYVDPIMVMYRQNEIIDEIVSRIISEEEPIPIFNKAHNENGQAGRHHLWAVKEQSDIIELRTAFEMIDSMYIADGHHRTAAACKALSAASRPPLRKGSTPMPQSSKYITALIFPDTQLNVLSFNRCVKSFSHITDLQFFQAISERFRIVKCEEQSLTTAAIEYSAASASSPSARLSRTASDTTTEDLDSLISGSNESTELTGKSEGVPSSSSSSGASAASSTVTTVSTEEVEEIQMYYHGAWYQLYAYETSLQGDIDAQILVDQMFLPIFKMVYPESEKNMVYVDGRQGRKGIEECVNAGNAVVGFFVRKVDTRQIMMIADQGKLLPPKATFFDPKPLSGLLLRLKR